MTRNVALNFTVNGELKKKKKKKKKQKPLTMACWRVISTYVQNPRPKNIIESRILRLPWRRYSQAKQMQKAMWIILLVSLHLQTSFN